MSNEWKRPRTAPRDGTPIIADFGVGDIVFAGWNGFHEDWCVARVEVAEHKGVAHDTYIEVEHINDERLRRWQPVPDAEGTGGAGRTR